MEIFVPAPHRLFEDEIVQDFLPPLARFLLRRGSVRSAFAAFFDSRAPGIRGALLCRTRRIDDAVRDSIRRGLPALVILGAGMDTRPYRLSELARVKTLELDLPHVQEFKKTSLARRFGKLPLHVRFLPIDFSVDSLDQALSKGGLSPSEPAMFVWEGVSQYLHPNAVDSVLRSIAKRAEKTELCFTYVLEEVIAGSFRRDRSEAFRKAARCRPEPWRFGIDPSRLKAFLAARGLTLRHDFGAADHQSDYLQPLRRKLEVSEVERVAIATVESTSPGTA